MSARTKTPQAILEYRVVGSYRAYGPWKDLEKAEKALARCEVDWERVRDINAYYEGRGPFRIEARYIGPWEPIEDAQTRQAVVEDNTEMVR